MGKHAITEPYSASGDWFLPALQDRTIAGNLTWSDRVSLELNDSFAPMKSGPIFGNEVDRYDAIHGRTGGSELVTVLHAASTGRSFSFGRGGVRTPQKFGSSWMVIGGHVLPTTLYSHMQVRMPGLEHWMAHSGIRHVFTANNAALIEVTDSPKATLHVACIESSISFVVHHSFGGVGSTEPTVHAHGYVQIDPDQPQCLEWFFKQLTKVTSLLSLMIGDSVAPDKVSAKVADTGEEVDVLVALNHHGQCALRNVHEFLMVKSALGVDFEPIFTRWFECYDSLEMPSLLALSVLSSKNLWIHVEFLSLMQALEGFHRATMNGLYATEEEYLPVQSTLINAIPAKVASDHRDALKSRIKYGNEISLAKRLGELAGRLRPELRAHILGGNGAVPRSWVKTRNYYTHWDEVSRDGILENEHMYYAHVRMRHWLRALYLDYVGIPQENILIGMSNTSKSSQHLLQLNHLVRRQSDPEDTSGAIMFINRKGADDLPEG